MAIELLLSFGIVVAALLAVIRYVFHGSGIVGENGEAHIAWHLDGLPKDQYKILNNVMLPTKDGTTTQIDHIVVCRYGIFVIETKNYSGWIFGSEKQRQWTQCLHCGWGNSKKYHFQNPLRQNWRHIYTLADLLELPIRYFHNVVTFCGSAEFQTQFPPNVMYSSDLKRYILSFDIPMLSDENTGKITLAIRTFEATLTEKKRQSHIANLKARHNPVLLAVAAAKGNLKCPKCGSAMVLRHRHSDNSPFYGCSKYPSCHGIMRAN